MCLAQTKEAIDFFSGKIEELAKEIKEMRSDEEINSLKKIEPIVIEKPPSVTSIFTVLRGGKN